LNRVQWRIDSLVAKLISDVLKDYLVAEVINTERAAFYSTIGVDLSRIPIPNQGRLVKVQQAQNLLARIRNRLHDPEANLDLIVDWLSQIVEGS
jgi:hypothetical protein